ncbi:MAG: aldo/keto reductase [Paraglaciecola sp.]|nr:aldo/keto reductase [Paraglaciecola sp.]
MQSTSYPLASIVKHSSPLIYGCMGLGGGWNKHAITASDIQQAHEVVDAALDANIAIFDHADIYTFGKAEQVFGEVLKQRPELRNQMTIQSKCGIRFEEQAMPKRYDFSKQWIEYSVNNSLQRLGIEQLDILMLHRPDPLMDIEEVATVFESLHASGKVAHFGVSNMQHQQMAFLQSALSQPLVCNQLELSLSHLAWLEQGVSGGCSGYGATNFVSGTIEYCQSNHVQLQSWGSLSQGLFSGRDVSQENPAVQQTAHLVATLSAEYEVSREAVILAWLMRHPANIQPVIGTTQPDRIKACAQAQKITLSREHWYALYVAARGNELP